MKLFLGCDISQGFWRHVYPTGRVPGSPVTTVDIEDGACTIADVQSLLPSWVKDCCNLGYNLDIVVFDCSKRRKSAGHYTHSWTRPLPLRSFYEAGDGVYISSPGFVFLQMAAQLDFAELIAYGDELCGVYSFDPTSPRGMRQRERPLISSQALRRYIDGVDPGTKGVAQARKALSHIVDNSASPMETVDEMLLALPYRLGGYGQLTPSMNEEIRLGSLGSRIAGKSSCKGDLCWLDSHLVIEHQGLFDHAGQAAFVSDRARINALKTEGYDVIELTTSAVHDLKAFEAVAKYISSVTGKRIRSESLGETPQRVELRRTLFGWNERHGRPQPKLFR